MRNSIFTVAVGMALLVGSAGAAHAVDATQKCQQAKLKAQGKLKSCLTKNAAGVIAGKLDNSAECETKFTAALQKADDRATANGTSCRYIADADTVSDLNTGLVWEKKTASGIHNVSTTYTWASSGATPNGTAFTTFLGTLNGGTSNDGTAVVTPCFTGHCDWRLPTVQELKGIVDLTATGCGSGSPCIDPAFGSTQASYYWSATTHSSFSSDAWNVAFNDGFAGNFNKTSGIYARAVRDGL